MIDITKSPIIRVVAWQGNHATVCPRCGKEEERRIGDLVEGFARESDDRLWVYCSACEYAVATDR